MFYGNSAKTYVINGIYSIIDSILLKNFILFIELVIYNAGLNSGKIWIHLDDL